MTPEIYWIRDVEPLRLAIVPRPRAGDWLADEISAWRDAGISHIVSLLEDREVRELELLEESILCKGQGIGFFSYPIPDRAVPSSVAEAQNLAKALIHHLRSGAGVAIHCRAGIGRSSVIAGCVLSNLGIDSKEAIRMLTRARRIQVPDTRAQEEWLSMFSQSVAVAAVQPGVPADVPAVAASPRQKG